MVLSRCLIATLFAYTAQCSYPTMGCVEDSGYINDWDNYFGNVQSTNFLSGVVDSIHDNWKEDRRWKMKYCQPLGNTNSFTSTFSLSQTPYDNYWSRECGSSAALIGGTSTHSNSKEDRIWTWYCGRLDTSKYLLSDCTSTAYVNSWDAQFSYYCPNNGVMTGMVSTHDNGKEDRLWAYSCCRIMDVPTPSPTTDPTVDPTKYPSTTPTKYPTRAPNLDPTTDPTLAPTDEPTTEPTLRPTNVPSESPTDGPTKTPTLDMAVQDTTTMAPTASHDDQGDDEQFQTQQGSTQLMSVIYILAAVIGALLCCAGFAVFFFMKRKKRQKEDKQRVHGHGVLVGSMDIAGSPVNVVDMEGDNTTTNGTNSLQPGDLELPPMPAEQPDDDGLNVQGAISYQMPMVAPMGGSTYNMNNAAIVQQGSAYNFNNAAIGHQGSTYNMNNAAIGHQGSSYNFNNAAAANYGQIASQGSFVIGSYGSSVHGMQAMQMQGMPQAQSQLANGATSKSEDEEIYQPAEQQTTQNAPATVADDEEYEYYYEDEEQDEANDDNLYKKPAKGTISN